MTELLHQQSTCSPLLHFSYDTTAAALEAGLFSHLLSLHIHMSLEECFALFAMSGPCLISPVLAGAGISIAAVQAPTLVAVAAVASSPSQPFRPAQVPELVCPCCSSLFVSPPPPKLVFTPMTELLHQQSTCSPLLHFSYDTTAAALEAGLFSHLLSLHIHMSLEECFALFAMSGPCLISPVLAGAGISIAAVQGESSLFTLVCLLHALSFPKGQPLPQMHAPLFEGPLPVCSCSEGQPPLQMRGLCAARGLFCHAEASEWSWT
ncbi:uncharacterized protein PHACADRAFT_210867 [Phanerochaete carnosa HHB-10118-sp]|uniref:Uncharacterized protein n=1 Tax=Phanerochaete carnosa (strain HHB-10118-sp) TaxID=650164 RepID=K5W2M3_PHACS|nr:uncharacterized protein PHACADRAFT_210867 [Phanerochaete carnosa HHB-10118-sp]EKM53174.1 hypothetical protein PHACADRAFT_210867 [Phanerochaete carnosa HHB-10118-sp]